MNHIDHQLFLFLNGENSPFFDLLMLQLTKSLVWFPLYLIFLWVIIRRYRWNTLIILIMAALMILVSDQLSVIVKDSVQRLRPSHEPGLIVHLVNAYKGGDYGFYSSHASNTFAVSTFLIILLFRNYKWILIPAVLWACIMSYSRIYLGIHFPGDLLAGALIGSVLGICFAGIAGFIIRFLATESPRHKIPQKF